MEGKWGGRPDEKKSLVGDYFARERAVFYTKVCPFYAKVCVWPGGHILGVIACGKFWFWGASGLAVA